MVITEISNKGKIIELSNRIMLEPINTATLKPYPSYRVLFTTSLCQLSTITYKFIRIDVHLYYYIFTKFTHNMIGLIGVLGILGYSCYAFDSYALFLLLIKSEFII